MYRTAVCLFVIYYAWVTVKMQQWSMRIHISISTVMMKIISTVTAKHSRPICTAHVCCCKHGILWNKQRARETLYYHKVTSHARKSSNIESDKCQQNTTTLCTGVRVDRFFVLRCRNYDISVVQTCRSWVSYYNCCAFQVVWCRVFDSRSCEKESCYTYWWWTWK